MTTEMNTVQAETGTRAGGATDACPAPYGDQRFGDQRAGVLELLRSFGDLTIRAEPYATRYQVASDEWLRGAGGVEEVIATGEALRMSCQASIHGMTGLVIPEDLPVEAAVALGAWQHSAFLHFRHRDRAAEANLTMLRVLRPYGGWAARVPHDQWGEVGPCVQSCLAAIRIHSQLMCDAMEVCMASWRQVTAQWDIPVPAAEG